jgi:ribosomal protein S18 acetylase RimI-like enzyme
MDPVREIEERSRRAWPPRHLFDVGGWEVRFAGGYTGRANSVNPFGPARGDLGANIRGCEDLFRERELRPVFRITPALDPPDLDATLEARGYVRRSETLVMVRDARSSGSTGGAASEGSASEVAGSDGSASHRVAPAPIRTDVELLIEEGVTSSWLQLISKWVGIPPDREPLHRAILEGIRPAAAFARIRVAGRDVACGLAVREPPWVGLFDLATDPERRGEGIGTALVTGLLGWGAAGGAPRAYLQVVAENDGAVRLYRRLGFRDAYRYWYRVSTEASPYRLPKAP